MSNGRPFLWLRAARGGKRIAYYRRGSILRRIVGPDGRNLLPDDPGFDAAFAAAAEAPGPAAPQPLPHSLTALIADYRAEGRWRQLAPRTREDYGRVFEALMKRYGNVNAAELDRVNVLAMRREFATAPDGTGTPARANKAMRVLSLLLAHAIDRGWRQINPCLRPRRLQTGPGYPAWTVDEFEQFMASDAVGEPLKRAAALAFYTGARVGDLCLLPKAARRDGEIHLTPAKTKRTTGARVTIPEHPRLTAMLDAAPPSDAPPLLTRADGQPWKVDHLKHAMTKAVRAAGLRQGLSFHGLRKALMVALAELGASDAELEALVPHADPKMTAHYRAGASQRRLAAAAMARLP